MRHPQGGQRGPPLAPRPGGQKKRVCQAGEAEREKKEAAVAAPGLHPRQQEVGSGAGEGRVLGRAAGGSAGLGVAAGRAAPGSWPQVPAAGVGAESSRWEHGAGICWLAFPR